MRSPMSRQKCTYPLLSSSQLLLSLRFSHAIMSPEISNSKEPIVMNKTELVKKVAAENELTQKAATAVVDSVLNSVMDSLAAREPVTLFGFGTFTCRHRDARQGRNPATGKTMKFAASNTPIFKPAKAFKEKVN